MNSATQLFSLFVSVFLLNCYLCGFESHTSPMPEGPAMPGESQENAKQEDQVFSETNFAVGDESLMQEWEQHMNDFVPTDMITFTVDSKSQETLFEDILKMPQLLRGAFFLTSDDNDEITFKVISYFCICII